jgi:hypothetical protein
MADKICSQCGQVGKEKLHIKGSFALEILLWLFFIVPGLIYSLWRMSTKRKACPSCSGNMIPLNSPVGQRLARDFRG